MGESTEERFQRMSLALVSALATNDIHSLWTDNPDVTINVVVSEDRSTEDLHDVMMVAAQAGKGLTSRKRCELAAQLLLEACNNDQECKVHGLALAHTMVTSTFNEGQRTEMHAAEGEADATTGEILDKIFGNHRKEGGDDSGRVH